MEAPQEKPEDAHFASYRCVALSRSVAGNRDASGSRKEAPVSQWPVRSDALGGHAGARGPPKAGVHRGSANVEACPRACGGAPLRTIHSSVPTGVHVTCAPNGHPLALGRDGSDRAMGAALPQSHSFARRIPVAGSVCRSTFALLMSRCACPVVVAGADAPCQSLRLEENESAGGSVAGDTGAWDCGRCSAGAPTAWVCARARATSRAMRGTLIGSPRLSRARKRGEGNEQQSAAVAFKGAAGRARSGLAPALRRQETWEGQRGGAAAARRRRA